MKEIFDREARKRFDDQHLRNRRKVRFQVNLNPKTSKLARNPKPFSKSVLNR